LCDIAGEATVADDFSSHVAVDLGGLREVVTWLRGEADSLTDTRGPLTPDVHFGHHSPCGETHAVRRRAASLLEDVKARIEDHRHELSRIADNLENAIGRYDAADSAQRFPQ
jgi:hypothetical protein